MKSITKSADEVIRLSSQKDTDEFFESQKQFLSTYHSRISDATLKADRMTYRQKGVADCFIKISSCFTNLATIESESLRK